MHYGFTGKTIQVYGRTLKQIIVTESFLDHEVGEIGGYIESEENLSGKAWVYGEAQVSGKAQVSGEAWVSGKAQVYGEARVFGKARVEKTNQYTCIGPVGSRDSYITICRASDQVMTGCFTGTREQFLAAVQETHGDNEHAVIYRKIISMIYD